jgi:hypothetical protein
MKIALMLHGQGRNLINGFNSLKKILDNYDVDVYCQVWWDDNIKSNGYVGARGFYPVNQDVPEVIKELYSPKKISVNKSHNFLNQNDPIYDEYPNLSNIECPSKEHYLSQLLSLKIVSNMFNWLDYDFIIRTRYDIDLISFPNLYEIDNTKFYPAPNEWGTFDETDNFFCDNFFIMSNDMSLYGNIFDFLSKNIHYQITVEDLYVYYLNDMGFSDKLIKLNKDELKFKIYV